MATLWGYDIVAENPQLIDILASLPPSLQGVAALGLGGALGYLAFKKFVRNYKSPTPPMEQQLIIGESARIADMGPVRELVQQLNLVALQMQKNEMLLSSFVAAIAESRASVIEANQTSAEALHKDLAQLADLLSDHLLQMRLEREDRVDKERDAEAEERGYQRGLKARAPPRRRAAPRKKAP